MRGRVEEGSLSHLRLRLDKAPGRGDGDSLPAQEPLPHKTPPPQWDSCWFPGSPLSLPHPLLL